MDSTLVNVRGFSLEPDWSREVRVPGEWKPWFGVLCALRDYQRLAGRKGAIVSLRRGWAVVRHRFWSAVSGADIPLNAMHLGGGLMIPHPNGVVIHPRAVLGPNVLVFQQVTIGGGGPIPGVPTIGARVSIGAGAKILGGVIVGDGAVIGANAVVIDNVPAGATAVGIPARIVKG